MQDTWYFNVLFLFIESLYLNFSVEKENDPEVFEELDGVVKSELFKTKKKQSTKVAVSAVLKSNSSEKPIPQTSKPTSQKCVTPSVPDFNIVATSSELFSESTEMSDMKQQGKDNVCNSKKFLTCLMLF